MTGIELERALLLTYAGVGAAFVVLGSLIVYTLLLGGMGHWRARRLAARQQRQLEETAPAPPQQPAAAAVAAAKPLAAPPNLEPPLAAAIAAAVAMAQEMQRRERAERAADREELPRPAADSAGWKEQGRIAAFDTRRLRERER